MCRIQVKMDYIRGVEPKMGRFIAFVILAIPAIMAAAGIKLIRDTFFAKLFDPIPYLWLQFVIGIVLFLIGFGFFAGFLLNRDRRNGRVVQKYTKKK